MKEIGLMMQPVDMEFIFITMEHDMKVIGSMTISMVKVLRLGLMDQFMREITKWVKRMDLAS